MTKNVLVTGGSGFVGINFQQLTKYRKFKSVSIRNNAEKDFDSGFGVVLHCAALVHQMKGAAESEYFKVNSDLTYEIACKAKDAGVSHFIFMSTVKVYGDSTTGKPAFSESDHCDPEDGYGKSKFDAERRLMTLNDNTFKVAIIRSPLVYGPGVKANMFNLIRLVDRVPVLPFGCIHNQRSMVFVENLIELIDTIIDTHAEGIYLASDTNTCSTTDLVKSIATALGKKRFVVCIPRIFRVLLKAGLPKYHDRLFGSFAIDPEEGWRKIGYKPSITTEQGIQKTVNWYLKKGANDE